MTTSCNKSLPSLHKEPPLGFRTLRMHGGGVLDPFLKALPEVQGNGEVGKNPWTSIWGNESKRRCSCVRRA
jgi:hypothetical protein